MSEPKFKRGDEVALIKPSNIFVNETYIVLHQTATFKAYSVFRYLVKGTVTNDEIEFRETLLYLYSPENRTKLLLGLDPD